MTYATASLMVVQEGTNITLLKSNDVQDHAPEEPENGVYICIVFIVFLKLFKSVQMETRLDIVVN